MRTILILLLGLIYCPFSGIAAPVSDADVTRFANDYAHAVESKDVEKIRPFFHPDLFLNLSEKQKQITDGWFQAFKSGKIPLTDPVWIDVKTLSKNPFPASFGKWKTQPQYQIDIQSYHSDGKGGEVGGEAMTECVAEKDGKLYIVRPLPD